MEIEEYDLFERFLYENYQILDKIGEGGCGSIFKAEQLSTGQIVAIKVIKIAQDIADGKKKQMLEQFDKEVKLCALLNHPNIIQLIDKAYLSKDEPYAVFEYIPGETLSNYILRHVCLSPVEMYHIMGQVLHALSYAHENGVAHGDLKPNNIMISQYGEKKCVKVLDFGIGDFIWDHFAQKNDCEPKPEVLFASPKYSAPERLRGALPTSRSDLYAWGFIVIECLTGQSVMLGNSFDEIYHKQLYFNELSIPAHIREHELGNLLKKVLHKDLSLRAGDASMVLKMFSKLDFRTLSSSKNSKTIKPLPNSDKTIVRRNI